MRLKRLKPFQSEKAGQSGKFICATCFFHQVQHGQPVLQVKKKKRVGGLQGDLRCVSAKEACCVSDLRGGRVKVLVQKLQRSVLNPFQKAIYGWAVKSTVFPLALDTDIGVVQNGQLISLAAGLAKFQCPPWFTPFRKHLAENCLGFPTRQSFAF